MPDDSMRYEDLPGPERPSIEDSASDLEWATALLPHIPTSDSELGDFRWAVANALATARRNGASIAMLALADELQDRAQKGLGWRP